MAVGSLLFGPMLLDECAAKPIKFTKRSETTSPVMLTATIASNGTDTTVVFNRPMAAVDAAGFTLIVAAVPRELTLVSGSGTDTFVFTSEVVYDDEIVSIAYASAIGDAEDTNGNDLENSGIDVTNNSTQMPTPDDTTPPELVSVSITSNGLSVEYVFNEAVVIANANGFTFTPSGGAATLTYASGSETAVVRMTLSRAVELDETATTEYTSTTGDVEDSYGNELETFGSTAVTNDSTYDSSDPYTPVAPETFNTDYDLPTGGTTHNVDTFAELQTAVTDAELGDVIVVQAGLTYTGNLKLPDKGAGTDWIYIISSDMADLPPEGERVALADAVDMPRLISNSYSAVHSDYGAHHYRFVGIEIAAGTRNVLTNVQLGYAGNFTTPAYSNDEFPHHITFDRCLIHSISDAHTLRHGIMLNGDYLAVVDCYIANCKDSSDNQAIWTYTGNGPFKIVNNFLEGCGMSIMFGGTDTPISGLIPGDIEFRGNHLFKRLAWKGHPAWNTKNSFELKNARRVLVSGNVMENNWSDAQTGVMVLFTVRNQSGTNPWAQIADVNFENNILKNTSRFFNITGSDNLQDSERTQRIRIHNNLGTEATYDNGTQPGFFMFSGLVGEPILYVTVTHNTLLSPTDENNGPYTHAAFPLTEGIDHLIYQNNILAHGFYNHDWTKTTNATHTHNVYALNSLSGRYAVNKSIFATNHPGEFLADGSQAVIGFEDLDGGDYRLDAASPFKGDGVGGVDPGCDIDELETATAGAVSGVW